MSKTLFLFTASYPFGNGETFIENEIRFLNKRFDKILILPYNTNFSIQRAVPENVEIVDINSENSEYGSIINKLRILKLFLRGFSGRLGNINKFRYWFAYTKHLYTKIDKLKIFVADNRSAENVFYTFWFSEWATVLSELKREKVIPKFISRAHGFDIYEERQDEGFIPFRLFQLEQVNHVYCASKASMNYLGSKYPSYENKIKYAYLGVNDNGINPWHRSERLTIVSCSNIIPLKRVYLIPALLKEIDRQIKWIHFGDGLENDQLKDEIRKLPDHIKVNLKGSVANLEILDFYKNNSVDVFVHLSESEGGVPVSIQEAISFAIPVIATDAGGINEIVNDTTGLLLPGNYQLEEVSPEVNKFLNKECSDLDFRKGVRSYFKKHFLAELNYMNFIDEIIQE